MNKFLKKLISTFSVVAMVVALGAVNVLAANGDADEERPSDVEELEATALDGGVKLQWSAASDNVAVTGYQVHYGTDTVDEAQEEYENVEDVGNVLEYTVSGLENDTTYYFSVVAYDAADNDSAFWAPEASATPNEDAGSGDDGDAPQVAKAEAINKEEVRVEFSEGVVLPSENPEDAFVIENDDTFEPLAVLGARMDEDDLSAKSVIITTSEQEEGANYTLTVGVDIEDKAGNSIISGTTDTAIFEGSGAEKTDEDETAPELLSIEAIDNTHLLLTFDEAVVLGIDPSENFSIVASDDATVELEILGVELGQSDDGIEDAAVTLTTSPQEDRGYIVVVIDLEDEAGNMTNASEANGQFTGILGENTDDDNTDDDDDNTDDDDNEEIDLTAPEDVASFIAKAVFDAGKYMVKLSWINSILNDDVAEQKIYLSKDGGKNYSENGSLGDDASSYDVENLAPGEYMFKITQVDEAGNESEGVTTKIILGDTGPGIVGLVLASLGLGGVVTRRKK